MTSVQDTKLHEIMSTPVRTITISTSVNEAVDVLSSANIRGVPVVSDHSVVGVLSMTDIVNALALDRIIAGAVDPREGEYLDILRRVLITEGVSVGNIMSKAPIRLPATATIKEACWTMDKHDVRRILVDQGAELVGIVTAMDIVRHLAR